jgi:hypothetical protein
MMSCADDENNDIESRRLGPEMIDKNAFFEREIGIERKRFSPIEPVLCRLEGKQLSFAASLTMKSAHQVRLGISNRI